MRRLITHWLDWAQGKVRQAIGREPRLLSATVRYQKAGPTFLDGPVPWNADTIEIEALCRTPAKTRRRADYSLVAPGVGILLCELMTAEFDDRHRLRFRFHPPLETTRCELRFRGRRIASVDVPVLSSLAFAAGVKFTHPTLSARFKGQVAAAPRFVASQSRGLVATALITSPTPLVPLAEGGLQVVFRNERSGEEQSVDVPLSRSQLASKEAVVTAMLPRPSLRPATWTVAWVLHGQIKAADRTVGVSLKAFHASLRVLDSRFVVADKLGQVKVVRQVPPPAEVEQVGPCFLVASGDEGIAGLCRLSIHTISPDNHTPTRIAEQDVLLTDGGTLLAPVLLDTARLTRCSGFELRHRSRVLASLSLSPVPRATLNAEGGFKPPPDFAWSSVADEELTERLQRLMQGPKS